MSTTQAAKHTTTEPAAYSLADLLGDAALVEPIHIVNKHETVCYCGAPIRHGTAPLGTKPGPRCKACAVIYFKLRGCWPPSAKAVGQ